MTADMGKILGKNREAEEKIKNMKKRVFGQMSGKLNIPDGFNDESDEINEMFYSK
jgi:hypothetical protein